MSSCPLDSVSEEQLEVLKSSREEALWREVYEDIKSKVLPHLIGSADIVSLLDTTLLIDRRIVVAGALRELAGYIASSSIEGLKQSQLFPSEDVDA